MSGKSLFGDRGKIYLKGEISDSYLDLHIEIDNGRRLKTTLYDFTFPIVNFSFIRSNIPAAAVYGVYISQRICYLRACGQ
jgi:hypothetical protein